MVDVNKLIDQDLAIAEKLVSTDNFDQVNIIGNRILQNLFIINDKKLTVVGFLIKEISVNLLLAKQNNNDMYREFQSLAKICVGKMKSIDFENQDIVDIWDPYFEFITNSRKCFLNKIEYDSYLTNYDFCNSASINYLNLLINNKNQLLNKNFKFMGRVRSELTILSNTTGNKNIVLSYLLVKAIEAVYKYALGNVLDEEFEALVMKFSKIMHEGTKLIENEDDKKLTKFVISNSGTLMWEYRKYYTIFGEPNVTLADEFLMSPQLIPKAREPPQ